MFRKRPAASPPQASPEPVRRSVPALPARAPELSEAERRSLAAMIARGVPEQTLRAVRQDMAYLEEWSRLAQGGPLEWPATEATAARFLAHHLFDPAAREKDPAHGMPASVEKGLREAGYLAGRMPPALSTINRRIASWSRVHAAHGLDSPFARPAIRTLRRTLSKGFDATVARKSARPVTLREMNALLATCGDDADPGDVRDRAMLCTMYATGGRRRSEVGKLRLADVQLTDAPLDPERPDGPTAPAMTIILPETKTTRPGEARVWAVGPPAEAVSDWLEMLRKAGAGPGDALFPRVFAIGKDHARLRIDVGGRGLSGEGVRRIVRARLVAAGLDPSEYSPHGLRSGFLTDAHRRGVPLGEAMALSLHRSERQALRYYAESALSGRAARLMS